MATFHDPLDRILIDGDCSRKISGSPALNGKLRNCTSRERQSFCLWGLSGVRRKWWLFVCALACRAVRSHVHGMGTINYGARFDFDGWMVIDTAVVNGELVSEAVRRGLSFGEAARLATALSLCGGGLHANQN